MPTPPPYLHHDDIALRIPHQGHMCLLDTVTGWDAAHIACQAHSHRAPDNPLRAHGQLGAACGIEFAAQAMAVHGSLLAESTAKSHEHRTTPRAGYLVSVRHVNLHVQRLDTIEMELTVTAERLLGDANSILYSFRIEAGSRLLLEGRATVMLDATNLSGAAP